MIKPKKIDIADTNLANFGTKLERDVKKASAQTEYAWKEASKEQEGLLIWRIEKFKVIPWPKDQYGEFFSGDSYIILNTYRKKGPDGKLTDAMAFDLHFWLGEHTTQDEAGTAAYKTVELDTLLDDRPVQFREVQYYESERFKSYFPNLCYLEGGVDSGFRKVEPTKYRPRLLHVKGTLNNTMVWEVPAKREHMNTGDVFLLDGGLKIYQFNPPQASTAEKTKANSFARALRDERSGKPELIMIDSADAPTTDDAKAFWEHVGGHGPLKDAAEAPADADVKVEKVLYRLTDGEAPEEAAKPKAKAAGGGGADPAKKVDGNPDEDAETLRKALKKLVGKDSEPIIEIMATRSREHLAKVALAYAQKFKRTLAEDITAKSTLNPQFGKLCQGLLTPSLDYECALLHEVLNAKLSTDKSLLNEILLTKSNDELKELIERFRKLYQGDKGGQLVPLVVEKAAGLFSKDLSKLLDLVLHLKRDESKEVDADMAKSDALVLYKAGVGRWGTDESKFIDIFGTRSFAHLHRVFELYQFVDGNKDEHDIETALRKEMGTTGGAFLKALLLICHRARGTMAQYYAHQLKKTMKGAGTDNRHLIHIVLEKRWASWGDIKEAFFEDAGGRDQASKFHTDSTLTKWIQGDTRGDYEALLLRLIGSAGDSAAAHKAMMSNNKQEMKDKSFSFVEVAKGKIKREMFDTNDVFVFDIGFEIIVWVGLRSSRAERRNALRYGQLYLNQCGKPNYTAISRILEGGENETFQAALD